MFLRFVLVYAAVFILVYLIPEHIHRRDFDKAFMAWFHDRTPQNEEALRMEQRKNEKIKRSDSVVIALVLMTLGAGIYFGIRFAGGKSDKISHLR